MAFADFIAKFFGKENQTCSKEVAKDRLKLVLVHDRVTLSADTLDKLKEELIGVITKYLDIEKDALEVSLNRDDDEIALVANIPVKGMKK